MGFSYSFHLSSKEHSVSTSGKVGQCSKHNLREYKSVDYDKSQIEILVGSETSILDDVKRIYHQEFDECLKKYNVGKREDRKISNYLDHVSDSRSDVAAEIIIQVGDKDFWSDKTMYEKMQMSQIFKDQLQNLEQLCPEFKIASAIVHYDEASPHMHVVGVPVASGYKKGMEKQVAKTKVFTAERLSFLQDKMRENMEKNMELCPILFVDKQLKTKEPGRNKDIPKRSLDEYYRLQSEIENLKQEAKKATTSVEMIAEAYEMVSNSVDEHKPPNIFVLEQEIKSGFFSKEKKYSVNIPTSSREEAEALENEIRNLYIKQYSKEAFKGVLKAFFERGVEKSEEMLKNAEKTILRAEKTIKDEQTILTLAKIRAENMIKQAEEKTQTILANTKIQYNSITEQVKQLIKQKDVLEKQADDTIQNAEIEAENIIRQAYQKAGTEALYNDLNEKIGLVPQADVVKAYRTLLKTWQKYLDSDYTNPTEDDIKAFKNLDADYMHQRQKEVRHGHFQHIEKDMRTYIRKMNAPHTKEQVIEEIEKSQALQKRNHIHLR